MSFVDEQKWQYGNWSLVGNSLAGIGTCIVCPELKVSFDVAQGLPWAFNMDHFLITHAHMDHAAGIPFLISQKALSGQKPPKFYMPEYMIEPMSQIMQNWQKMEGHQYDYQFIATETGKDYPLKGPFFFRTFPTIHRVESNGYCVFQKSKKLKPEYQNCDQQQILDAKSRGEKIEEFFDEPLIAFTGDTQIEFLDGPEFVRQSKILIMEVTYIDSQKTVEGAREWGHIHFDELVPRLSQLKNEKVVLMHLSARYRCREFEQIIKNQLPTSCVDKFVVFPRDGVAND